MKTIRNERGITLIEVLAAMAILSIILISIMNFFPQMGMINNHNKEKAQAINTAKLLLNEWKLDSNLIAALKKEEPQPADWPGTIPTEDIDGDGDEFYLFTTENPRAEIKIWKEPPNNAVVEVPAHEIQIRILNDTGKPISETYGYIVVK
ncbi:prepilin-type N-terminal cleavage/methylation domain-containing protein [Mesobacillus maritimus]|uniref:prepilin-type N-terminal cleavage/methylation domain-containing protein n=1 Tax=Mesobacillus maritimus TaxID=1643336 RepID=UPI00385069F5